MKLQLSNSVKVITISPEDVDLASYVWNLGTHGYPQAWITELKKQLPLHQVIMARQGITSSAKGVIEHLNGDPLDNRRENLRKSSQTVNMLRARGGSVRWHKQMRKWQVRLTYQYKEIHVGYYDDEALARNIALIARDQLLQMIANTDTLTPSQVKLHFSKRKT